jgi:hypothetical protein
VVTPEEPLPLAPEEKGKAPMPTTTTPMVLADDDEEDGEDLQPLSRRSRQPLGKILGQSTSGSKRGGDEEKVPAAPAPKRRRSTTGRGTRHVAMIPSDSEETLSERGVPADAPAADTEEEVGDGAVVDEASIVDDPVPPTPKEPVPEPSKNVAPGGERTTSPMAAIVTEAGADSGVLRKTQGSAKKFKKKSVIVKKIIR